MASPGQDPINVLGERSGRQVRRPDFIGYRQLVNRPFVNQYDSRLVRKCSKATRCAAPRRVSYMAGISP